MKHFCARHKPLHPSLPHGLLSLRLISILFERDDFFQLREHLRANHYAKRIERISRWNTNMIAYLYERP